MTFTRSPDSGGCSHWWPCLAAAGAARPVVAGM